ncbi:hypothetical protein [Pseudomonas mohnii]
MSIRQLPVGQGGFLISEMTGPSASTFTYAFDCGSLNREHFEQGLSFCSPGKIDVLFVSHLDADHINGIDALMAHMQVDTVVLPCLDALHMTMIACEAIGSTGIRMSVHAFLADPTQWFAARGVKRVLHLQRGSSHDETEPFDPNRETPLGDGPLFTDQQNQNLHYTVYSKEFGLIQPGSTERIEINTLGEHSVLTIGRGHMPLWLLVPYVHPFPEDVISSFRQAVAKLIPQDFTQRSICSKRYTKRLLELLADEESRKALKRCYTILSSDNNKPSMSLFSGAHPKMGKNISIDRTDGRSDWRHNQHMRHRPEERYLTYGAGAWLSTGDANLESPNTYKPWLERYRHVMEGLDVFVLPHHGSNRSIGMEVLSRSGAALLLVCAAKGRAKHPHPTLLSRLRIRDKAVWQVSEDTESVYTFQAYIDL